MRDPQALKQYRNIQISTVDRGRLLLMMYEGGIKFLKQAKAGLEAKDLPKFARFLSKSQAIIAELLNTLDHEKGGQIAEDLERLYDFMLFYLTEANLQKSPEKLDRVIRLLEVIANAYHEIIDGNPDLTRLTEEALQEHERKKNAEAPATAVASPSLRVSF